MEREAEARNDNNNNNLNSNNNNDNNLNSNNNNNNNNNNDNNNNNNNSTFIPETDPEAVAKREEVLDAMAKRDEIGRIYTNNNNEPSEFQDGDTNDPLEEAELSNTLEYNAKELRNADDKVAELNSQYKNMTGKDVPGASE